MTGQRRKERLAVKLLTLFLLVAVSGLLVVNSGKAEGIGDSIRKEVKQIINNIPPNTASSGIGSTEDSSTFSTTPDSPSSNDSGTTSSQDTNTESTSPTPDNTSTSEPDGTTTGSADDTATSTTSDSSSSDLVDYDGGTVARYAEPVVMKGILFPNWSRIQASGAANLSTPSGADAHNGNLSVTYDARAGVPVEQIVAYRWDSAADKFIEIPIQIDQRFPYFLVNSRSKSATWGGTDQELTYQWDSENWKKVYGTCTAQYESSSMLATADPVATLDDDDEIVFMASDAGDQASADTHGPAGTTDKRYQVTLYDPATATSKYVYLFLKAGGSSFNAENGYVTYVRDTNADEYIDRYLNSACSGDRFPRDGVSVSTAAYKWYASGRWAIKNLQVAKPNSPGVYGEDLLSGWTCSAFYSTSEFSNDEAKWETYSATLGEKKGPVRAIREVWGGGNNNGKNLTKTEYFYRNAIVYRYDLSKQIVTADGLHKCWDYNPDAVTKYYDSNNTDGVDMIDGEKANGGTNLPLAYLSWSQVSGHGDAGSLVYVVEGKAGGQQWQFAVPTGAPQAVGSAFAQMIMFPITATASEQDNSAPPLNNVAPVANAGADQTVEMRTAVQLDGTASSDANGDSLTYKWEIVSKPQWSQAALDDATSAKPKFTA
ncbi:MAG: PKD domain-containing protein, partial [Smithellaceae bacterium]|nr:PKD domain-containing protein [Smithellaceae bacterium]